MGFLDGLLGGLSDDYRNTDDSAGSIFGAFAGGFLRGAFGGGMSVSEWIDQYADSRDASGVGLFLNHAPFGKECSITAVVVDHDGDEIDSNTWTEVPYDRDVKALFEGKKEQYYTFE
jgi:hypothetical protein